MFLDRDSLKNYKPKLVQVDIPELDGYVYVRSLTTAELRHAEESRSEGADSTELIYWQVLCGVCNAEGDTIFTKNDESIIADLPFSVVAKLSEAVNEASGLNEKNP